MGASSGMVVRRARALARVLAPPLERACAATSHADPRARLLQLASLDKHASTPRLPPFVGPSSYACPLTQAAVGALLRCNS